MHVKKSTGKVYGASLSASEKKAMDIEIRRQIADYTRCHNRELDAMILWELHEQFKFGPKKLKRFYDNFAPAVEALVKRYEMDESDDAWLCTHKLKEYGIDLEQWEKERGEANG